MTKDISHVVSQNTKALIRSLIDFMYKSQEEANRRVMNEYYDYIKNYLLIKLKMKIIKDDRKGDIILNKDGKEIKFMLDPNISKFSKQREIGNIKKWLQFPIIGFNNSFYDINICKDYDFMKIFDPSSAIKQGSRYKSLSNDKICILDQMAYVAAGTSLDKYLKSRETDMIKGHFPYRWLTSFNKLNEKQLPPYKYFERTKTSEDEYKTLHTLWVKENMSNMFDYLKYYNNLDVIPLIQGITKHRAFYYDLGYDMHKDAISLSGLAEKIMFKNSNEQHYDNVPFHLERIYNEEGEHVDDKPVYDNKVYLINEENKKCFYLLKDNNVGGPSIVFHRYHEKDVTHISNVVRKNGSYVLGEEGKLVKKIIGFDANALYVWSLSQDMPTSTIKYEEFTDHKDITEVLKTTFGFYEVDIEVPNNDEMYNKFLDFPPIFKNSELKN